LQDDVRWRHGWRPLDFSRADLRLDYPRKISPSRRPCGPAPCPNPSACAALSRLYASEWSVTAGERNQTPTLLERSNCYDEESFQPHPTGRKDPHQDNRCRESLLFRSRRSSRVQGHVRLGGGLRQAASCSGHCQSGAAPDQPVSFSRAGEYGDRRYPGNCGGNLIKDLLRYFQPRSVFDPMSGSGTCRDVCNDLAIPCIAGDIHEGFDAADPAGFSTSETFDFIWAHPPYWRQKLYANDPRDLSRTKSLSEFLKRYGQFIRNCGAVLKSGGKLAILMGDYNDREIGFVPLTYHTKQLAFNAGLRQCCTDIIRFSHGASSGRKSIALASSPTCTTSA